MSGGHEGQSAGKIAEFRWRQTLDECLAGGTFALLVCHEQMQRRAKPERDAFRFRAMERFCRHAVPGQAPACDDIRRRNRYGGMGDDLPNRAERSKSPRALAWILASAVSYGELG